MSGALPKAPGILLIPNMNIIQILGRKMTPVVDLEAERCYVSLLLSSSMYADVDGPPDVIPPEAVAVDAENSSLFNC